MTGPDPGVTGPDPGVTGPDPTVDDAAPVDDPAPGDAIRDRLLRMDRVDTALRQRWTASAFQDDELADQLGQLTSAGIIWLRDVVRAHGWPGHAMVGREAAAAASRLLQHTSEEPEFRRSCLGLMRRAAEAGDLPYREVAYVTDALELADGRAQRYATKFERVGDDPTALQPLPLDDPAGVDDRRAQAGLPSLAEYAAVVHERFAHRAADDAGAGDDGEAGDQGGDGGERGGLAPMDWQTFHARFWNQRPVRLSGAVAGPLTGPDVFPADEVFALARRAAEPFRLGTRAWATTDVTFHVPRGQLRSPGDLLPGAEDADFTAYAARMATPNTGEAGDDGDDTSDGGTGGTGDIGGWHWSVRDPFGLDVPLWSRARDQLSGLWEHAGWPAVPLTGEIAAGSGYRRPSGRSRPPGVAVLVWVLRGSFHASLWEERPDLPPDPADHPEPDHRLHGGPGDLLHWPSDVRYAEHFTDDCLIVRFAVHATPRTAEAVLKNLLADRVSALPRYADDTPFHVPFPAPDGPDGRAEAIPRIAETGTRLHDDLRSADLHRTLLTRWALRRSAAGLEPVPRPASDSALEATTPVRVTSEIVRMPDGDGALWAVNGHPLPLSGATAEEIRRRLVPGRTLTAAALCQEIGVAPSDDRARTRVVGLLRTLHRLHALAESAGTDHPDARAADDGTPDDAAPQGDGPPEDDPPEDQPPEDQPSEDRAPGDGAPPPTARRGAPPAGRPAPAGGTAR